MKWKQTGIIGFIVVIGLILDDGDENGNYYSGVIWGLGFRYLSSTLFSFLFGGSPY